MSGSGRGGMRSAKTVVFDKFYGGGLATRRGEMVATRAKNCDFEKGALRCGYGALAYHPDFDPTRGIANAATVYGKPKLVFTALVNSTTLGYVCRTIGGQAQVNRIFMYDPDTDLVKHVVMPSNLRTVLSYVHPSGETKAIFCCEDQLFFYDFVNKSKKIMADTLTGACLYHERLFVSNKSVVKYTTPMDISNFEADFYGGGEIDFRGDRGEIVWLECVGESVYVFMQYGISIISASGVGSEFQVLDIPYGGGHIIPRTMCTYEQRLVFATYDGIYVLDGKKCSKFKDFQYSPMKDSTLKATAGLTDNRYFLYYVDEAGKTRSLAVDLEDSRNTSEYFILHGINQSGGKAVCAIDYAYCYLDRKGNLAEGEGYVFEADARDLGSPKEKTLTYLSLYGCGSCTLTVVGRYGEKTFVFDLGDGVEPNGGGMVGMKRKRIGLFGRKFSFKFTLQKGCVIEKMVVEYDELGGVK